MSEEHEELSTPRHNHIIPYHIISYNLKHLKCLGIYLIDKQKTHNTDVCHELKQMTEATDNTHIAIPETFYLVA